MEDLLSSLQNIHDRLYVRTDVPREYLTEMKQIIEKLYRFLPCDVGQIRERKRYHHLVQDLVLTEEETDKLVNYLLRVAASTSQNQLTPDQVKEKAIRYMCDSNRGTEDVLRFLLVSRFPDLEAKMPAKRISQPGYVRPACRELVEPIFREKGLLPLKVAEARQGNFNLGFKSLPGLPYDEVKAAMNLERKYKQTIDLEKKFKQRSGRASKRKRKVPHYKPQEEIPRQEEFPELIDIPFSALPPELQNISPSEGLEFEDF